mgnify:FL=1
MTLESKLESILFFKAEPVGIKRLAEILGVDKKKVEEALVALEKSLTGRGVALIRSGGEVELRAAPEASGILEKLTREELSRDLGKAGAETLAVVLYRGQATRREIDWIRGVNSAFTLRELAARGLIARKTNPKDARGFVYEPTVELLAHLGVARVEDLPDYADAQKEFAAFDEMSKTAEN